MVTRNSRPLNVCHVITSTQVGGAETQLARLIAATSPTRMRHFVVGLGPEGPRAADMRAAGAEVISLGLSPGPGALLRGLPRLAVLLKRRQPDVVQTWLYHANLLGLLAAEVAGVSPVVWGVRGSNIDLAHYGLSTRIVARSCIALSGCPAAIVANSFAGAAFHARLGYPAGRIRVIPNGFDTNVFRPDPAAREAARCELDLGPGHFLVGQAARFHPVKDHATFLQAAALVAKRLAVVRFVCLGLGVEAANPALRAALEPPLAGRTHLLGRRGDVPRWLAALDLHVSSSAFGEGLSNAVAEAMAAGVPNVVTSVGDSQRLVGETGLVVPPRDPTALAAAIEDLLRLPRQRLAELGREARRRIEEHYSLEAMVRGFTDLYQELTAARTAAAT